MFTWDNFFTGVQILAFCLVVAAICTTVVLGVIAVIDFSFNHVSYLAGGALLVVATTALGYLANKGGI